ncbi:MULTISPECIES: M20/M25/M40 family metallo-hydrolase [unclassified Bacillus (in: firmicutes)]|uniref:M20/M25/M40 family metallo-hydrolase n=1 Tax=unclassified Bacillus (in: firmicutes) TaxID=185979 RepID=UPI0008F4109E|nr:MULTISPECIES: M20/M25/M40 family metallo-hydrolase [unclassified Bacillus (in: firmicutes)]SFA85780.1 M42 glutamyl aminopeptidase [Bacillus sp. UNCCL13]SFQ83522.1 M42 glutamyl aminopeptidase [Bacillus sp. cl95]
MKTWNQLLVQYGWMLTEEKTNVFQTKNETIENMDFLIECLAKAQVNFSYQGSKLVIHDAPLSEQEWIKAIDFKYRGRGEGLWFRPGIDAPKVRELDTYIAGIVRQLNRLGFHTMGSCDGHERNAAYVMIQKGRDMEELTQMLLALGVKHVHTRERANHYSVSFHQNRTELLATAEKMSFVQEAWLEKGFNFIKEQMFYKLLEELLSIPGVSGHEGKVRDFVKKKMEPLVDKIAVDRNGNLLAEKTYKTGIGPTILLNAHLDIAYELEPNRSILKNNHIWSSSEGILGADDRAGVAVLVHMAEHLLHTSDFNGKVKYIFTVKEECGLVGAQGVDEYFLWGTDAAIVVDRRGSSDIVVSCGGYIPFCDPCYGEFFETTATQEGLAEWKCTPGGSSDTRIWASHGIQSVNVSAGYRNEHTEDECLDVAACYRVTKLLKGVFSRANELRRVLRLIERRGSVEAILEDVKR